MSIEIDEGLLSNFDERELRLIRNCLVYYTNDPAGVPGHNLMIIVAKLMKMIQDPSDKYIVRAIVERLTTEHKEYLQNEPLFYLFDLLGERSDNITKND